MASGNVHWRMYKHSEVVDVLLDGIWEPGIVKSMLYQKGFRYVIDVFKRAREVTVSAKSLRPSEHLTQEVLNDMMEDMPDPSQEILPSRRLLYPKGSRKRPRARLTSCKQRASQLILTDGPNGV